MANGPSAEDPSGDAPFNPSPIGNPLPPELTADAVPIMRPRTLAATTSVSRWEAWLPVLNNRLILSGLGLVVVLLLISIVLVSIGRGNTDTHPILVTVRTPDASTTALPGGGLNGRVLTTVSVRNGPGATYGYLGTVPRGAAVAVVGRNGTTTWLQIPYPPGSPLRGWLDANFVQVTGDVSQLAVAGPGPTPFVSLPTASAPPTEVPTIEATSAPTQEQTPGITATPTSQAGPTPTEQPGPTPTEQSEPTATPPG